MRMLDGQLAHVLDHEDPFPLIGQPQQRAEQRRLPGPGAAADKERHPSLHQPAKHGAPPNRHTPGGDEVLEAQRDARRHPQGEVGTTADEWRQDRMQPHPRRQDRIHVCRGVIQAAPGQRRQPHRHRPADSHRP